MLYAFYIIRTVIGTVPSIIIILETIQAETGLPFENRRMNFPAFLWQTSFYLGVLFIFTHAVWPSKLNILVIIIGLLIKYQIFT